MDNWPGEECEPVIVFESLYLSVSLFQGSCAGDCQEARKSKKSYDDNKSMKNYQVGKEFRCWVR